MPENSLYRVGPASPLIRLGTPCLVGGVYCLAIRSHDDALQFVCVDIPREIVARFDAWPLVEIRLSNPTGRVHMAWAVADRLNRQRRVVTKQERWVLDCALRGDRVPLRPFVGLIELAQRVGL